MGSHLYQPAEIKALSKAIKKSGRAMLLSISPGPAPVSEVAFFQKYAQMWRISDDFWDDWKLLRQQFEFTHEWAPFVGVNNTWPDADMLPIGRLRITTKEVAGSPSKFTHDEQQTMMTLWSIFRSPLIMGGDLPTLDDFTLSLLTNPEVLAVNQGSRGGHPSFSKGNIVAWIAEQPSSHGSYYVAVFNIGDVEQTVNLNWKDIGVDLSEAKVRDLWTREDRGILDRVSANLRPHASLLFRVSPAH